MAYYPLARNIYDGQAYQRVNVNALPDGNLDAFSRLRISQPVTLFDAQFQYDLQPLLYEQITVAGGSIAHAPNFSSAALTVNGDNAASAAMQSRQYHRYQPGKSQLVIMTGILGAAVANVRKRMGYFDVNNGIYLEQNGTADVALVRRTYTSGQVVNNRVVQANWNIDSLDGNGPSGQTIDLSKSQILVIDLQWLGMGRVRVGFDIDGVIYYCHQFLNANVLATPYMTTANLPVRVEITNAAASAGATMHFTCVSVISEGGFEEERGFPFAAYNAANITTSTARTHLISIRPATTFNSITNRTAIIPADVSILSGNAAGLVEILYGSALSGGSWVAANASSAVEYNVSCTISTAGRAIDAFFVGTAGGVARNTEGAVISSRLPLTLDAAGSNPIALTLAFTAATGTPDVRASIAWRELR